MSDKRKEEISALMDGEASELELHRLLKSMDQDDDLGESWSRYHSISGALKGEIDSMNNFDISARVSAALEHEETYSMPEVEDDADQLSATANSTEAVANKAANDDASWVKKLWQPVAQAAVAASVAVAVVTGWQGVQVANQTDPTAVTNVVAQNDSQNHVPEAQYVTNNRSSIWRGNQPQVATYSNVGSAYNVGNGLSDGVSTVATPGVFVGSTNIRKNPNAQLRAGGQLSARHQKMLDSYFVTHTGNASVNATQGMMPFARVVNIEVE